MGLTIFVIVHINLTTFISKSLLSLKSLFLSIIAFNDKEEYNVILLSRIKL